MLVHYTSPISVNNLIPQADAPLAPPIPTPMTSISISDFRKDRLYVSKVIVTEVLEVLQLLA